VKPPPFDFLRAESLVDVWDALNTDADVKLIAGGQSLVPLLSLRFASPSTLVDISGLHELRGVESDGKILRLGALTRHVDVETHPLVKAHAPLLARAASWVAHAQIRNRGTIGGSVAHGDAAAELPAALLALDATVIAWSREGERRIPATEFFESFFTTALTAKELIAGVELPIGRKESAWAFEEFARRRGDYAIGGAAVYVEATDGGVCQAARAGLIAAGPAPCLAPGIDEVLVGHRVDTALIRQAVAVSMRRITPSANVHGSADYRAKVIGEMLRRALTSAFDIGEAS